jgi:hypothetical protein
MTGAHAVQFNGDLAVGRKYTSGASAIEHGVPFAGEQDSTW